MSFLFRGVWVLTCVYFVIVTMHNLNKQVLSKSNPIKPMEFQIVKNEPTRLSDVKGIDEINEEILNLIKQIKYPYKYKSKGAKTPKGVLLFGDPGVGKTLLARAIAGESKVNFIHCSGSQFDEMIVGVGTRRVKELFKTAQLNQPCIIFIDEIDSLLTKSR